MKENHGVRLVLLLFVCAICIVSALALEDGDNANDIAEPQARGVNEADAAKVGAAKDSKPILQLSLEKLGRQSAHRKAVDLFAVTAWQSPTPPPAPVVVAKPVAPPPPTAPPLPFTYMGKFTEPSGKTVVYLGQGEKAHTVSEGDTIDGTYRVDSIDSKQLTLTYVPLDIKQTLPIGTPP